jgi:hypothetical protein
VISGTNAFDENVGLISIFRSSVNLNRHHVSGISSYEEKVVVVCENFGLVIINKTGEVLDKIAMKGNKEGPVHFLGQTICYAESKKGIIHVMTITGVSLANCPLTV